MLIGRPRSSVRHARRAAALSAFLLTTPAHAHFEHRHQVLGTVHFPVTCSAEAQAAFDQAMKLQHSFWHTAAVHMPSHIFTRVGDWESSVASNARSAEAARKEGAVGDELHALDYMVYAHLQMGQTEAAKRVVDEAKRFTDAEVANAALLRAAYFALAAMPARLVMERGAWNEAEALTPLPSNFPVTTALTHFTRAVGFARSGKPDQAGPDIEALKAAVEKLKAKEPYWMEQVDIQRQAAEGWVAFASGRQDEGIRTLQAAADREAATEKHVITPGPLAPMREQLGEMLLEAGRPGEALLAFQAVQVSEPNRFRAIFGTARAAEQTGNRDLARQNYAKLLVLAVRADHNRPELVAARAFAAAD
ncbi:hypothetical protein DK389_29045 [Methylobacterium durans]|uniref:Tetratricopeptide repeat protein n=1 Tax=Methylobacterium durans TaxID=2202825 RepID=A0A2U8WCN8_9HYPH|nr:hypothetical protein DK389_29045 [Methylobacterium durans]